MSLTLQTNFTPSPNSPKISQLPELTNFTGEELILAASNGKNYTIPKKLFSSLTGGVTVYGPTSLYVTQTYTFVISNFDMSLNYTVSADVGTVSTINVLNGEFTYTAPATSGPAVLNVNGNTYNLTINPALTNTPTIIVPSNLSTISCNNVLVSASAFSNTGPADTQLAANWQLATDSAFTNIVQQSLNDTVHLNSYLFENLNLNTTYYVRVSYVGNISLPSSYSQTVTFTTGSVCYPSEDIYELVSSNIQTYGIFGQAVVSTLDGSVIAVSAPGENTTLTVNGSLTKGNVYIYNTTTFPYILLQTIASPNSNTSSFGDSLEISSDGNYLFIGDPLSNSLLNPTLSYAGVVYVYKNVNNLFTLIGTIEPAVPAANFYFGQYVKMSQDRSTLVISSYAGVSSTPTPSLFVYAFNSTSGTWTLSTSFTDTLIAPTVSDANYGLVFDVNSTGTTIVTSSYSNNGGYGVVFVYTNSNGTWTTTQILPNTSNVGMYVGFGNTLSLSPDGTELLIGASNNNAVIGNTTYYSQGQVFYYLLSAGSWVLTETINAPINQNYLGFGYNVKVSPDGTTLVIIGQEVYVYIKNSNGQYTYTATLESVISNLGNWSVSSNYSVGNSIPNQFVAINNANNRLYIGSGRVNSETFNASGIVYTFSCFQNPSFSAIAINTNGSSGGSS
jgi:hypothetical protein